MKTLVALILLLAIIPAWAGTLPPNPKWIVVAIDQQNVIYMDANSIHRETRYNVLGGVKQKVSTVVEATAWILTDNKNWVTLKTAYIYDTANNLWIKSTIPGLNIPFLSTYDHVTYDCTQNPITLLKISTYMMTGHMGTGEIYNSASAVSGDEHMPPVEKQMMTWDSNVPAVICNGFPYGYVK